MLATGPPHSRLPSIRRPLMRRSCLTVACVLLVAGCSEKTQHQEAIQHSVTPTPASKPEAPNEGPRVATAGHESALTEVDKHVIEWFDSLGFPDLAELKLVRITFGGGILVGNEEAANDSMLAFLLSSDEREFSVLTLDLNERQFALRPAIGDEHVNAFFEVVDLNDETTRYLQQLRRRDEEKRDPWSRFGRMLSERGELVVLARACAAHGLDQTAHDLLAHAIAMPDLQTGRPTPANELVDALSEEFAQSIMWQNVLAFGEPDVPRPELLDRFQRFVKSFPNSGHAGRAKKTVEILTQMVEEDKEHAKQPTKPLVDMTVEERVAELIYQLRDQNGKQFSQPGSCNIFMDPRDFPTNPLDGLFAQPGKGKSPASQLVAIGYDAVPQLIAVIGDQRFTRSVEFHRNFYFSHHVLRVGHCAVAIIEEISGQKFFDRTYNNPVKASNTKVQIERWWAVFQRTGEMQTLIDGTITGNQSSPEQAQRLLDKYPETALQAIAEGTKNAKNTWTRSALLQVASQIPGDESVKLVLDEVNHGSALVGRVAAARLLLARDHPQAIPAMIAEWKKLVEASPAARKRWSNPENYEHRDGVEQLILFLANSGQPASIRALDENLADFPVDYRLSIVAALGSSEGNFDASFSGIGLGMNFPDDPVPFTKEAEAAAEKLLISSLTDTAERWEMSGNWSGKSFDDPRVCDIAAHVLAMRQPDKYSFDLEANTRQRDRQRITMINVWRAEQGLTPLPLPEARKIERARPADVEPLLQRLIRAQSDPERQEVIHAIENLGLNALHAVRQRLEGGNSGDLGYASLETLADRLAVIVDEVTVLPTSFNLDEPLTATIDRLKGKPLTSDAIVDLLLATAEGPPEGTTGMRIAAEKYADDTGISVTITFTRDRIPQLGSQKGWDTSQRVTLSKKSLFNSSGSASFEHAQSRGAYDEVASALDQAISAGPEVPFSLRVGLIQQE